jgi:two-component system KDP operon response regulator KdpE
MNENQTRILVVDDESQIRKLLNISLTGEGFKIFEAVNGREGATFTATNRPDLVILDLGLPDMSGLEVLKQVREWSEVPVIILSVQDDSETIVEALNIGADDYMTKPFEARELIARVRVCLRRVLKKDYDQQVFEARNIKVDLAGRIVTKDGAEVKLTSTEYDLLKYLIKNANKVLTNRQILKEVWGPSSVENAQYPRVYVRHLRQKLEDNPDSPKLIVTESGVGYRLKTKD